MIECQLSRSAAELGGWGQHGLVQDAKNEGLNNKSNHVQLGQPVGRGDRKQNRTVKVMLTTLKVDTSNLSFLFCSLKFKTPSSGSDTT